MPQLARCSRVSNCCRSAVYVGLICLIHLETFWCYGAHLQKTFLRQGFLNLFKSRPPKQHQHLVGDPFYKPRENASISAEIFTTQSPGSAETQTSVCAPHKTHCLLVAWHGNGNALHVSIRTFPSEFVTSQKKNQNKTRNCKTVWPLVCARVSVQV